MSGTLKQNRVRMPFVGAFRNAFEERDAKRRNDQKDESGDQVVSGRRTAGRGAVSESELQRVVSQDLEVLMNTVNLASSLDLSDQPHVGRSILNFGFPDIVHRTIDELAIGEIGDEIELALSTYEPRIAPGSIEVRRDTGIQAMELKVRFIVRAELSCEPLNLPVEFVAEVERDTGKITIGRA